MDILFEYLCSIWIFAGCLFGMVVIAAILKAAVEMFRRK